ncbi:MAG TPA: YdcH family protein [Stenotrophomonas sp.]|nr:YdcH family protein [Stenotrophomonas sp.]
MENLDPATVADRLHVLRREHRQLDEEISQRVANLEADELTIKRLKKRKLQLKDCIAKLESALIPDEPA